MAPNPHDHAHDPQPPVLHLQDLPVPGGRLSFMARGGDIVQLEGGTAHAQLRLLAIACGHAFGGPGRCVIDGQDTRRIDAAARQALRARAVARALQIDQLPAQQPLLPAVAQHAVERGLSPTVATVRAAAELERLGLGAQGLQPCGELDAAARRLALVVRARLCRPRLLVLERPDEGLDAAARLSLRRLLAGAAQEGSCVLLSAQHASFAALATHHLRIGRREMEAA